MNERFAFKLNNRGILLVEHLIALIITALLTLLILNLLPLITHYESNLTDVTSQEFESLATHLQKEAKLALSFSASDKEINFHTPTGTIKYRITNKKLMRLFDNAGGEVALYHCTQLKVTLHNEMSATLNLTTATNQNYAIYVSSSRFPLTQKETLDE